MEEELLDDIYSCITLRRAEILDCLADFQQIPVIADGLCLGVIRRSSP